MSKLNYSAKLKFDAYKSVFQLLKQRHQWREKNIKKTRQDGYYDLATFMGDIQEDEIFFEATKSLLSDSKLFEYTISDYFIQNNDKHCFDYFNKRCFPVSREDFEDYFKVFMYLDYIISKIIPLNTRIKVNFKENIINIYLVHRCQNLEIKNWNKKGLIINAFLSKKIENALNNLLENPSLKYQKLEYI